MPSSGTRRRTARAASGSFGGPQIPSPVIRIAPKPRRWTSMSPTVNVPEFSMPMPWRLPRGTDREHLPAVGDPLELVLAPRLELDLPARDQVAHRPRHEHLAGAGQRRHPRADVHGDPAKVVATYLALAGVDPGP